MGETYDGRFSGLYHLIYKLAKICNLRIAVWKVDLFGSPQGVRNGCSIRVNFVAQKTLDDALVLGCELGAFHIFSPGTGCFGTHRPSPRMTQRQAA
jgi:hypothetical protein